MELLNAAARTRIVDILRRGRDMTLATIRPDGYPQATTISYVHDGLAIYAAIGLGSQKAGNIQHNSKVSATINLDYSDWAGIRGISLGGVAGFVQGAETIAHVAELLLNKFPEAKGFAQGSASLPWQGLLFIRIDPSVISLLDYSRGFGHTELYEIRPGDRPA
jgi:hypothetical protein